MLKIEFTSQFKKDFKTAIKRGCAPELLEAVISTLAAGEPLPAANRDHKLTDSRKYKNMRECHIQPDWLLVYQVDGAALILQLIRTGSHSDLF